MSSLVEGEAVIAGNQGLCVIKTTSDRLEVKKKRVSFPVPHRQRHYQGISTEAGLSEIMIIKKQGRDREKTGGAG